MSIKDFSPEELIGKHVLINDNGRLSLDVIEKVSPKYVYLKKSDSLYSVTSGDARGSSKNMWRYHFIELITEEKANEYRKEWSDKNRTKELKNYIALNVAMLSLEQLQSIADTIAKLKEEPKNESNGE